MSFPHPYNESSDADDEYDHDNSPHPGTDGEESGDEDSGESDHTPTTYGNFGEDGLPRAIITDWTVDECADFISTLGLDQYADILIDNNVVGESLIALDHELLKEMEILSVGHRLTILKSVYDVKISQDVPVEPDHYVPLTADDGSTMSATQADLAKVKEMVRIRDERIIQVEKDLRKITDEYRKLREEVLPLVKMAKDRSQPLPPTGLNGIQPYGHSGHATKYQKPPAIMTETKSSSGGLSRTLSKRSNIILGGLSGLGPPSASPTQIPIEASPAALAAATNLTSSMTGPKQHATLPSPTSPNTQPNSAPIPRSYPNQPGSGSRSKFPQNDSDLTVNDARSIRNPSSARGYIPSGSTITSQTATTPEPPNSAGLNGPSPSVEIFKSFRVSMDDPCHKVLPAALRQYKIEADWRTYALYIVYGDEERCLALDEKPLTLFKQLMHEGRKPMFMLRKVGSTENEPLGPSMGASQASLQQPLSGRHLYSQNSGTPSAVPGGVL